jgi:HPt (histidine-containing phosphotransfer) domain-containing protein
MNSLKYRERITSYLCQRFNFPEEQVVLMLPEFMSTLSSHMERLEGALKENKLAALASAGHTIKGAFLNLGLSECAEIALQIEQSARNSDDTADYPSLVASLRLSVNGIINE